MGAQSFCHSGGEGGVCKKIPPFKRWGAERFYAVLGGTTGFGPAIFPFCSLPPSRY